MTWRKNCVLPCPPWMATDCFGSAKVLRLANGYSNPQQAAKASSPSQKSVSIVSLNYACQNQTAND